MTRPPSRRAAAALGISLVGILSTSGCLLGGTTNDPPASSAPTPSTALTAPATPTSAATPTTTRTQPSSSGSDSSGSGTALSARVPLSADAAYGFKPVWGVPIGSSWTPAIIDKDGVNQLKKTNGCMLTTTQNLFQGSGPDAAATATQVQTVRQTFQTKAAEASIQDGSPLFVPVGPAGTGALEFAVVLASYRNRDTNTMFGTVFAVRAMPTTGAVLTANLSCPKELVAAELGVLTKLTIQP